MKKYSRFFFSLAANIRKLHLSWFKYICCIVLVLTSCPGGKTQMHFAASQNADFIVPGSQGLPFTEVGFRITDLNISSNLSKGFEFRVMINTDVLDPDIRYNIFAVGYYKPGSIDPRTGEFCTVMRLVLEDGVLFIYRAMDNPGFELIPLRLWNPDMVFENDGLRTIQFNIDSFSTKIYNYNPAVNYSDDQICELSFWGLLGSEAKRIFEDPCWPGAFPAVLLPVNETQFVSAHLFPYKRINISPAGSSPVTGGSPASPQLKQAAQKEPCSCPADSISLRKKKDITRNTLKMPKIPMYLKTTAVVAEDKKEQTDVSSFEWNIYPNPTTDMITLEINSPGNLEVAVELTDQQGRKLFSDNISVAKGINRQTISLRRLNLTAGMYFIRMWPATGGNITEKEQTRKIILQ